MIDSIAEPEEVYGNILSLVKENKNTQAYQLYQNSKDKISDNLKAGLLVDIASHFNMYLLLTKRYDRDKEKIVSMDDLQKIESTMASVFGIARSDERGRINLKEL